MRYIAIFRSARDLIRCDEECRTSSINTKIITVPEKLSKSCGMSIEFKHQYRDKFKEVIKKLKIEVSIYDKQQI